MWFDQMLQIGAISISFVSQVIPQILLATQSNIEIKFTVEMLSTWIFPWTRWLYSMETPKKHFPWKAVRYHTHIQYMWRNEVVSLWIWLIWNSICFALLCSKIWYSLLECLLSVVVDDRKRIAHVTPSNKYHRRCTTMRLLLLMLLLLWLLCFSFTACSGVRMWIWNVNCITVFNVETVVGGVWNRTR